ncbi:hypothetical protein PFMALIP_00208 [Plasmodium falciparum MaliPS096_E11]|uniref:Uncharacterized protein n=1 Tax=Plasmodium falciparum MaliPS096_E11 TaxID=1036727 RepID=A0A024WXS0_PLAFA|nr:hypothetical protein PFMALIP_00208 [Plasmodium falciparum MaliPS096_E11]
MNLVPFFIFV